MISQRQGPPVVLSSERPVGTFQDPKSWTANARCPTAVPSLRTHPALTNQYSPIAANSDIDYHSRCLFLLKGSVRGQLG